MGEIEYSAARGSESTQAAQKLLADAVRRFARSIELCDDYLRGYYGLKKVCMKANSPRPLIDGLLDCPQIAGELEVQRTVIVVRITFTVCHQPASRSCWQEVKTYHREPEFTETVLGPDPGGVDRSTGAARSISVSCRAPRTRTTGPRHGTSALREPHLVTKIRAVVVVQSKWLSALLTIHC
jgi:hypothetical protein